MRLFLVATALPALLLSQQSVPPRQPAITAHGEATVAVKPNQATIAIGVVSQAATAHEAAAVNAKQTDAAIAALKRVAGATDTIQTISYILNPVYKYPKDGGEPTITGYSAASTVQVKMSDLNNVGRVIDTAVGTGANRIQGLHFSVKDEQAVRRRALGEATRQARENAEAIASSLGSKITRIVSVVEGGGGIPQPPPRFEMARMAAQAVATPIEPGTVDVRATVTLTAEISQ